MKKADLRKIYKQKRTELTFKEIEGFQNNIYQQIYKLDFSKINIVHLFLSMKKFREIDTKPIIDFLRKQQKQLVVSRCNFKENTLSHFILEPDTELEINKFGVPEPINATPILEKEIDLVFVPLLISDKENFRVGYGKGYYDRFLSNCKKDCKKIGLNFFKPIAKISDINEFDIALDEVIYSKSSVSSSNF